MPKFKPGQSGNPAGRPKGSRTKFGEAFLADLQADWQEHGAEVIARVRAGDPSTYLRVCAGLMPKQLEIEQHESITDGLTAQERRDLRTALESFREDRLAEGAAEALERAETGMGEASGGPAARGKPH